MTISCILILGLPGVGKSTLGKKLAQALGGHSASIGDILRGSERQNQEGGCEALSAMKGEIKFSTEYVCKCLETYLKQQQLSLLILDACGPPIEEVLIRLGLQVTCVFYLEASDNIRQMRLAGRSRYEPVPQDNLYEKRAALYKKELPVCMERLSSICSIQMIRAEKNQEAVLYQALSAYYLIQANNNLRERCCAKSRRQGGLEDVAWDLLSEGDALGYSRTTLEGLNGKIAQGDASDLVFLIKGGCFPKKGAFDIIQRKFEDCGYMAAEMAVVKGDVVRRAGLIKAHLGRHYLLSKHGDIICDWNLPRDMLVVPSEVYLEKHGIESLNRDWYHSESPPQKRGSCFWTVSLPDNHIIIVNGHIPSVIESFENSQSMTIAIRFSPFSSQAKSLPFMRSKVLGQSDPEKADHSSLRYQAWRGELPILGRVCFQNNAFHLSSGPAEAVREIAVWFGRDAARQAAAEWRCSCGQYSCLCPAVDYNLPDAAHKTFHEKTEGATFAQALAVFKGNAND